MEENGRLIKFLYNEDREVVAEETGNGTITRYIRGLGNTIEKTEKVENRFCYNGEMLDPVTQQYYLRARFYNPVIGRFTQEDTYYGDGLNLYQYYQANPVGYVDPSGHNVCPVVQNHYDQYQEYRKQHPEATAADAYKAVTGKDPLKKDAGESGKYSKYLEQLDDLPENKVNHIIEGSQRLGHDHRWDCLVEGKEWGKIEKIICNVMEDGTVKISDAFVR